MEFEQVGVVGGGTMGAGIAQVAIQSGRRVTLVEVDAERADKAMQRVETGLQRLVKRERMTELEAKNAMSRLSVGTGLEPLAEVKLVVEAVFEDVELKQKLFADLDSIVPPEVILASNTSTIPIVILAASTSRADRVAGLHFFNPVPAMKLVEVISTPAVESSVISSLSALATDLGKSPVVVGDVPGFVGNLLVVPFLLDAVRAYERNVASKESIDNVIKLGFNHPMGPLALADLIGLDIVVDMAESMYEEYKDPKYFPSPLIKQLVRMGDLGRKTGKGFYSYDK